MRRSDWQRSDEPSVRYEISVLEQLDESWSEWFGDLEIVCRDGSTTLSGVFADQASLRGILSRMWDLNLTLVSVTRIETHAPSGDRRQGACDRPPPAGMH